MDGVDVVLHVGMQQSGSGLLQRALSRLRPQLRRQGVAFVGHSAIREAAVDGGWLATEPDASPEARSRFEAALGRAVETELAATRARRRTVLISSDNLLGAENVGPTDQPIFRLAASTVLAQVVDALGATRVRAVCYTRRQDRLMELCYAREVLNGARHAFDDQFPYADVLRLDYRSLVARIGASPGIDGVVVRPVELVGRRADLLAADVLKILGLAGRVDLSQLHTLPPPRTVSSRGLEVMRAMNGHLQSRHERSLAKEFVLANFAADDDFEPIVLSGERRAAILDTYREANADLFRDLMPDLPIDGYATDAATRALATRQAIPRLTVPRRAWRYTVSSTRRVRNQFPPRRNVAQTR